MSLTMPKKRGRPSKKAITLVPVEPRTDEEIIGDLDTRFSVLERLTLGAMRGAVKSLIVSGAPGVGKSYTIKETLEAAEANFEIVAGGISTVYLYMMAYKMREHGSVLILDDVDSVFNDEESLNLLKALCDTGDERKISWLKDSASLKGGDETVPQSFVFDGSIIFVSNIDFDNYITESRNKLAAHMEALMSRSLYLDLKLHGKDEILVWMRHVAEASAMHYAYGVTEDNRDDAFQFISENRHDIRVLSLRTLVQIFSLIRSDPDNWETTAQVTLCK